MAEETDAVRIAAENKRKLEEHLAKLKKYRGRPPREEEQEQPQGKTARPTASSQEAPGTDPRRREKWEAFKRLHGHRIHHLDPQAVAQAPEVEDYKLLGVSSRAGWDEIRRAFHRLAKQHHPDRGGDAEHFQRLWLAYERIKKNRAEA